MRLLPASLQELDRFRPAYLWNAFGPYYQIFPYEDKDPFHNLVNGIQLAIKSLKQ